MRNFLKLLASCFIPVLLNSCAGGNPTSIKHDLSLPKSGVIHKKLSCKSDNGRTYALYLPSTATDHNSTLERNTTYPVMIAFDPHGDGSLPLSLYKELADRYGIMLIGSNDSKNGLPQEEVKSIVLSLMSEIRTSYPVDTNRIYLLGFSGGARVASIAAMYLVPVKGVIGCGAGLGGTEQPVLHKFDYFGYAGTADFNMHEMLSLEEPLTGAGIRHFIRTFPGIHAWPPPVLMEDAFMWITLNAMKDGSLAADSAFISRVAGIFRSRIEDSKKSRRLIEMADACGEAISFLDGLSSAGDFQKELVSLKKSPEYQSQVAYRLKMLTEEDEEKQEFMALQSKDLSWWKEKIKKYNSVLGAEGAKKAMLNPEDTLKNKRLLSFLSLYCYMNANASIARQDEPASIKIVAVYELADPKNPEPNYMRAILLARRSEHSAAIEQLKIAVAKGFNDRQRLTSQPEFQPMNGSPGWFDLMKTIK